MMSSWNHLNHWNQTEIISDNALSDISKCLSREPKSQPLHHSLLNSCLFVSSLSTAISIQNESRRELEKGSLRRKKWKFEPHRDGDVIQKMSEIEKNTVESVQPEYENISFLFSLSPLGCSSFSSVFSVFGLGHWPTKKANLAHINSTIQSNSVRKTWKWESESCDAIQVWIHQHISGGEAAAVCARLSVLSW